MTKFLKSKCEGLSDLRTPSIIFVVWIVAVVLFASQIVAGGAGQWEPIPKLSPYEATVIAVIQEARDESHFGKVMVAGTILDRLADPQWPDTEHQVVYQPWQITGIQKDIVEFTPNDLAAARLAVAQARRGIRPCGPKVFWYHNISITKPEQWGDTIKYRCQVGDHIFYGR